MGYFDLSKDTYVTVDASPMGISAILTQCESGSDDHRVIAYASRSLSAAESRYSQTEKEALSIVWAVEHFHIFLYGKDFTLVTDHKPLEIIYGNSSSKSSARIERGFCGCNHIPSMLNTNLEVKMQLITFHSTSRMLLVVCKKSTLRIMSVLLRIRPFRKQ